MSDSSQGGRCRKSSDSSTLAWLFAEPSVSAPIIGPRTMEQLEGSLRALEIDLDDAALARLDEIFPGHRTAPEDYAW